MVLKNKINDYLVIKSKGLLIVSIPGNGKVSETLNNCLMLGKHLTLIQISCINFKDLKLDLWGLAIKAEDYLRLYEEIKI